MGKQKQGLSTLQRLIEDVDTWDISMSKKNTIKALAEAEITRRQGDQFAEFHRWIKRGDKIISDMLEQLNQLKEATDSEGDLVSLSEVMKILEKLKLPDPNPDLPYDKGRNWALHMAAKEIEKLPRINLSTQNP